MAKFLASVLTAIPKTRSFEINGPPCNASPFSDPTKFQPLTGDLKIGMELSIGKTLSALGAALLLMMIGVFSAITVFISSTGRTNGVKAGRSATGKLCPDIEKKKKNPKYDRNAAHAKP
eukprot:CAMPEP_0185013316 /NCGR_PEP_ID=MMETSP1098-20130426/98745_1 /TAXON_ID=89044 /ORGANISM="Spumella elongata, Strain CCAP 955/1" /LENGTH=118 /DNA_ID=CAMNT_0027542383 /DNA_START=1667 /DNA_END=2023 /DNA_ORIENTATION=-